VRGGEGGEAIADTVARMLSSINLTEDADPVSPFGAVLSPVITRRGRREGVIEGDDVVEARLSPMSFSGVVTVAELA